MRLARVAHDRAKYCAFDGPPIGITKFARWAFQSNELSVKTLNRRVLALIGRTDKGIESLQFTELLVKPRSLETLISVTI